MTICFKCDKVIIEKLPEDANFEQRHTARYKMWPVEQPYINVFFHTECFPGSNNANQFILDNVDKLMEVKRLSTEKKQR